MKMKNMRTKTLLTFFSIFFFSIASFSQGYKIDIKVNGLPSQKCRLAYYFQNKTLLKDTAISDAKGNVTFKGKEPLPSGIYMIVLANDMYTEFIVSDKEQVFSIETDTTFSPTLMKFKGSRENEVFYDFNRLAAVKGSEAGKILNDRKLNFGHNSEP
jgi:hypothetical protein